MTERRGRFGTDPAGSSRRATRVAAVALSILFPFGTWLVGGSFGLGVGLAIVAGWWILAPGLDLVWGLSVALLALAPLTILFQGLPHGHVVGAGFGGQHLLAHRLATLALDLAAFAALVELVGSEPPSRPRPALRFGRSSATRDA